MRCYFEPVLVMVGAGRVTASPLIQVKIGYCTVAQYRAISAWMEARKDGGITEAPWPVI